MEDAKSDKRAVYEGADDGLVYINYGGKYLRVEGH
jgi:hypothetical protein